jgi:glucokinase
VPGLPGLRFFPVRVKTDRRKLLAGDIGGTNTRLAVFPVPVGGDPPVHTRTYPSRSYSRFEDILAAFFDKYEGRIDAAVFAAAGPVHRGTVRVTNLPWTIDEESLKRAFPLPKIRLINDVEAVARSLPLLPPNDLFTLHPGEVDGRGNRCVIAPGTGLGEAFLVTETPNETAVATEGGHTDFAPATSLQIRLLTYLLNRHERVSVETVCSGPGIHRIFRFLTQQEHRPLPGPSSMEPEDAEDPTAYIVETAMAEIETGGVFAETLRLFAAVLGAEAGNLALKTKARGGIYLGGGIPPRIRPFLEEPTFLKALQSKGLMADLVARIPVHIIQRPDAGLLGAAACAEEIAP